MKILSIAWYKILPAVFGGQKGIAGFNAHLSRRYPLTCLCSVNNEPGNDTPYKVIPQLPVSKTQFLNPFCWKKIIAIARQEQPTHIILEHPYHGIAAYQAAKKTKAVLVLHSHNIESERFRQIGKVGWRLLQRYEKWIHRKAGSVLFKTTTDRDFAITHFDIPESKCRIVPYGIEKKELMNKTTAATLIRQRHSIQPGEKILLFAGTLDYAPNADAAEAIYQNIAPLLEQQGLTYRVIICGRNKNSRYQYLEKLNHPLVIRTGEVTDIDTYFSAADVFINPVLQGSGIQTKNIEALQHHCNLVCFENMADADMLAVAAEKIFTVPPGEWREFVQQIQEATVNSEPTPESFFGYYEWERIVEQLTME